MVFPELSLTGYELDLAPVLAFSERDPRLTPLTEWAADHEMTLVVGAPVRMASRLYIGAFIISPQRTIDLYTKHHLGLGEEAVVHPGNLNPLVRVGGQSGAVARITSYNVCYTKLLRGNGRGGRRSWRNEAGALSGLPDVRA